MSTQSKRARGKADEVGGKIKKGIGKVVGNEKMQAEGLAREKKGAAQQAAATAAERTKGKAQEIVGGAKDRVGAAIGNEQMKFEGRAKKLEGEARSKPKL